MSDSMVGSIERWWTRIDPTRPSVWMAQRARGHAAFVFRHGALPIGLPLALLLDFALLVRRHDLPLLFSAEHAIQLEMLELIVGIPAGLIVGRLLWRVGERRSAQEQLTRAFDINPSEPR
jgi:hypothetical protein